MTAPKDPSREEENDELVQECRAQQLARETYRWLDERLADRDRKDVLTLEYAAQEAVD